jgi:small Trp-rich protein
MYLVVLGVLLLTLKLLDYGPVGAWAWWLVLLPFAVAVAWWTWADKSGYNKRREMEKMDARRADRRQKNMEALGTAPKRKR